MMQFEYMQVAHPYGVMYAHDLNAYGQQGWQLVAAISETNAVGQPTGLTVYTFMRAIQPDFTMTFKREMPITRVVPASETHEHEPRASRRDPVVSSAPSTDSDPED